MLRPHLRGRTAIGFAVLATALAGVLTLAIPAGAAPAANTFEIESGSFALNDLPPFEFADVDPCFMETEVDTAVDSIQQTDVLCGPITSDLGFDFTMVGDTGAVGSYTPTSATTGTIELPFNGGAELSGGCFIGPIESGPTGPFLEGEYTTSGGVTSATLEAENLSVPEIMPDDDCDSFEALFLNGTIGLPGEADVTFVGHFADFPLS